MKSKRSECDRFSEDLTAFAQGELPDPVREDLERHLKGCPACRKTLDEVRHILHLAGGLPHLSVSSRLHERMMDSVRLEEEALKLSLTERLRLAGGFMAYKLRRSGTARYLLFAAAAQILVALALYLTLDLTVQDTGPEEGASVFDPHEKEDLPLPAEEVHGKLIFPEEETYASHRPVREFDPPKFDTRPPRVTTPGYMEADSAFLDISDVDLIRRIEMENRLELSRYRMCARMSVQCKDRILRGRGGGSKTEYAVERGIKWLRAHQNEDGSWSPGGVYGGDESAKVGITALAAVALLSDGHSQKKGRYLQTVSNGIHFIIANQDLQGRFGWTEEAHGISLFNHSTAVLALAENYILCGGLNEKALTAGIESLIRLIAGTEEGDEGISLDAFSETWAAMALRTSVMTGLQIEGLREAAAAAEERVALLARRERRTGIATAASKPPLYTASKVALDALFHEEERTIDSHELPLPDRNHPETLFALLDDADFREPSFLFFIGTALREEGGMMWDEWNRRVKAILTDEQQGDGLWLVEGDWPWIDGGDIYTTSLHLLTLQVYYRYIKLEENCN